MVAGPYSSTTRLVRGRVVRITKLDVCGNPVYTKGTYTTRGFIQAMTTKNMDAGDEIKVRIADGTIDTHEPGQQTFINYGFQLDLSRVNPGVVGAMTGDPVVLDWQGTIVGWEELALQPINFNFAVEIWTASSGTPCVGGSQVGGYTLYPMIGQAYVDWAPVTDKEINLSIKGISYPNPFWLKGPYGGTGSSIPGPVAGDALVPPTPSRLLQPVSALAHKHFEITPIAPPPESGADGMQTFTGPTTY